MLALQADRLAGERGVQPIFSNLSFTLQTGELGTVIGPNGLGKTTLLRILAGLSLPTQGSYQLTSSRTPNKNKSGSTNISLVADTPGMHESLTVMENLNWACAGKIDDNDEQIISTLKDACLFKFRHRKFGQLSRGQKQRVGLLRAIFQKRLLWLLDEPFAHLDKDGQAWFVSCLLQHLDDQGMAIMTAHHQPDFLLEKKDFSGHSVINIQLQAGQQ